MGDRYWTYKFCPKCGNKLEIYYAESSGFTDITCTRCGTIFEVIIEFQLKEKGGKDD